MRKTTAFLIAMLFTMPAAVAMGRGKPDGGGGGGGSCPADVVAAVEIACPCDGRTMPDASTTPWRNHGQYVSCVARTRNQLRRMGCLVDDTGRTLVRCAAKSTCGKSGAVLCCVPGAPGTCDDAVPGDGTPAGTCMNDSRPCDVDADCSQSKPTLARDEALCQARGGVSAGPGSVCGACVP